MEHSSSDAVIRFEPDGFDLSVRKVLGRQSAGHGFLRAAIEGRGEGPIYGYTPHPASAEAFVKMVRDLDPAADPRWIKAQDMAAIGGTRGVIHLPDPGLPHYARLRMHVGSAAHSICGVTHTLSTPGAMQIIADLLSAPVMPWDALICTSTTALGAVREILGAEEDYLRWRFGPSVQLRLPQLPVIPLGTHCRDFAFTPEEKAAARRGLGLADDEVAALHVGRLVFSSKAHPFPMFAALQAAAERTGKKLVLILCGHAPAKSLAEALLEGAATYAPDVRVVAFDSIADDARRAAWAAGDFFISLVDGIQETFGLTPIEAMAAGLPTVVSDWNGYRDTVRDGIDGFRIATWAPEPNFAGVNYSLQQDLDLLQRENFAWSIGLTISVDLKLLIDRVVALVEQPDLRRRMGLAGQARARELYDWRHVYRQYQALWGDLNARRAASPSGGDVAWAAAAPRAPSSRLDPFQVFRGYPTALIGPGTIAALRPGAAYEIYLRRCADKLFPFTRAQDAVTRAIWTVLEAGEATVEALSAAAKLPVDGGLLLLGSMAKMGMVDLRNVPADSSPGQGSKPF